MKQTFMASIQSEINAWPSKFKELTFVQKGIFLIVAAYVFLAIKENTTSWDDLFELDTWKAAVGKLFTIKHGVILTIVYFLFFGKIPKTEEENEKSV